MLDCVIVGVTFPGLALGALLAKQGKKVLLLERREGPGGRISSWQREGYLSLQGIPRIRYGEKGPFARIFKLLGLPLQLEPLNQAWILDTDEKLKRVTIGKPALFPAQFLSAWDRFRVLRLLRALRRENLEELEEASLEDWFVRNRIPRSLQKYFLVLAFECTHVTDPDRISAGETLRCFLKTYDYRCYLAYPRKGWPNVLENLEKEILKNGEIRLQARVDRIEVQEGRVRGVRLGEEFVHAACVVGAIPCQQMIQLLPEGCTTPEYLQLCRKAMPSAALIVDIAFRERVFPKKGLWFFLDPPGYGAFLSNLSHLHAPAGKQLATFVCPCSPQEATRPELVQTFEKKIEENLRLALPVKEVAWEWKRSHVVHMLDSIAIRSDQTRKDRPGYRVPGVEGLFLVGDSTCAPGSCWELEYESVLACGERILGMKDASIACDSEGSA